MRRVLKAALGLVALGTAGPGSDVSGTWYSVDPNGPDNRPVVCTPIRDMADIIASNNGVNPVHIFTDKNSVATRIEVGDGPMATGFARSAAACIADYRAKEDEFMRDTGTVTVQLDKR